MNDYHAILLRAGFGKNSRRGPDARLYQDFFGASFLHGLAAQAPGVSIQAIAMKPDAEGLQALSHAQHSCFQALGVIGHAVGVVVDAAAEDDHVSARIRLIDHPDAARIDALYDAGATLGLSILYSGIQDFTQVDARRACVWTECTHLMSIDIVAHGAAGGRIITRL